MYISSDNIWFDKCQKNFDALAWTLRDAGWKEHNHGMAFCAYWERGDERIIIVRNLGESDWRIEPMPHDWLKGA